MFCYYVLVIHFDGDDVKKYWENSYVTYKNTNRQQMHKESFIINRNTPLHVSTLLGHLQGELFRYPHTRVALYN
jgi:hypothetical protein